jgi:hypothetical protein
LFLLAFLPWMDMGEMSIIYLLILYFGLSLSYQLFIENTLDKYFIKKIIHHEKT